MNTPNSRTTKKNNCHMFFRIAYKDNFLHVTSISQPIMTTFSYHFNDQYFSKVKKEENFKLKRLDISSFKNSLALN